MTTGTGRAALAAAALLLGCGAGGETGADLEALRRDSPPSGVRVLLVGIDGASGQVLEPLMAAGRLPAFARLRAEGAWGELISQKPMLSPAIWTTIATGHDRERHGVVHFLIERGEGEEPSLVTSRDRRTLALWNLASAFGRSVGVVGWWATWPAEPVRGFVVSDRMTRSRWAEWTGAERGRATTFPPTLEARLRPLVVDPADPPLDELRALVELTPEEQAELLAFEQPLQGHGLSVLKFAFTAQRSYERMLLELLGDAQPDLCAVLLIANDPISHTFWHHYEPAAFPGFEDASPRLAALIPNMQVHNDRTLAQLRARVDPETVVMVVSDHGFQASGRLPEPVAPDEWAERFDRERAAAYEEGVVAVGRPGRHRLEGLFAAAGGPIRAGVPVRAGVRDVAPTVLALLGLPVPEDLPGRVLEEILEPAFLAEHPVRRIPSYEGLVERVLPSAEAWGEDPERLEMLRSLGYIK